MWKDRLPQCPVCAGFPVAAHPRISLLDKASGLGRRGRERPSGPVPTGFLEMTSVLQDPEEKVKINLLPGQGQSRKRGAGGCRRVRPWVSLGRKAKLYWRQRTEGKQGRATGSPWGRGQPTLTGALRGQERPAFLGDRTSDANGCPDMVPATPFVSLPFLPLSLLLSPPLPSLSRFHRLPNYSLLSVTDTIKVVCRGPCHKWHLRSSPNGEWPLKRRAALTACLGEDAAPEGTGQNRLHPS